MKKQTRITSIKPGRAPSFMGGMGSLIAVLFGLFWTVMAIQITREAPFGAVRVMFPLFGILFTIMGVVNAVYSFRNATGKRRYSLFEITDSETEPDPFSDRFGMGAAQDTIKDALENAASELGNAGEQAHRFCPYCGKDLESDFRFCPSCGKQIPE